MTQESHDHNSKNLLADFPKEALEWILPEATQKFGAVLKSKPRIPPKGLSHLWQ